MITPDQEDGYPIPHFSEFDKLSQYEQNEIMVLKSGNTPEATIERLLCRVFLYAIKTRSADVHITATGDSLSPKVQLSVKTPGGLLNFPYLGPAGKHFRDKMFQLCNTANGGTTPPLIATRFDMTLPESFARGLGLQPIEGAPYQVDMRVQYNRTFRGFSFITRLLDQQTAPKLEEFRLTQALLGEIKKALNQQAGLFLVTGPTGSGKSTFLKACLDYLNNGKRVIYTVEDPVEYTISGDAPIHQIQVSGEVKFSDALRAGLRSAPDVIFIGEIRDEETMLIAMQAAQTGHFVLATLHANTGILTVSRALDLLNNKAQDAPRLATTLKFVVATRLLNMYEGSTVKRELTYAEASWLKNNGIPTTLYVNEVAGVKNGKKVSVMEAFYVDSEMQDRIASPEFRSEDIYNIAKEQIQYESLPMAGARMVDEGYCILDECSTMLEGDRSAQNSLSMRALMAKTMGTSLGDVSKTLDAFYLARQAGGTPHLEDFVKGLNHDMPVFEMEKK